MGRRGGAVGPVRRELGGAGRPRVDRPGRRAFGRGWARLVAGRARRPRRRLAGDRGRRTSTSRSGPGAGRPTTSTTAATSTTSTRVAASVGDDPAGDDPRTARRLPRPRCSRRSATCRPRRSAADEAWGWVFMVLHGHQLDHLGILEPWAAQLRRRQDDGDPFGADPRAADAPGYGHRTAPSRRNSTRCSACPTVVGRRTP